MSETKSWSHTTRCAYCESKGILECKHRRGGKTAQERKTGAASQRLSNRQARVEWQQDSESDNRTFPLGTCNGKKSQRLSA